MKRFVSGSLLYLFLIIFPLGVMAEDYLAKGDALFGEGKGGLENYKGSIALYLQALEANPNDYEANWKCARAYRSYAEESKRQNIEGWQDIAAIYGKEGMKYAEEAIKLEPDKPDGYFYYALNMGTYREGVFIFTALWEGLKDKTQRSLEKVYELDKNYAESGAIMSLGRFWAVLPWPFRDREKALEYFREYQRTEHFYERPEGLVFLGELLLELGGEENKAEARLLLEEAALSDVKYFSDRAKGLLAAMKQ